MCRRIRSIYLLRPGNSHLSCEGRSLFHACILTEARGVIRPMSWRQLCLSPSVVFSTYKPTKEVLQYRDKVVYVFEMNGESRPFGSCYLSGSSELRSQGGLLGGTVDRLSTPEELRVVFVLR